MNESIIIEPLGNVFKTTSGGTPSRKKSEFYQGDIPWVKSGELENNIIFDTEEKITEDAIKNSSAKIFPVGTILIALYGATIGKLAFLGIKATTNQAICGIFDNGVILSKYTYYFLLFSRPKLVQSGIGGAQPNISQDIVRKQPFPIIPLPEQRAIVSKIEQLFGDLDNGIENFKKAQEQLKIYRQAVLKNACEGKLVPTEAELARVEGCDYEPADVLLARILKERREKWDGKGKYKEPAVPDTDGLLELPDGWCWANVGQIAIVGTGATPLTSKKEYYENGSIPWITSTALNELYIIEPSNFVTEKALQETNISLYPKHTILVAMYGEGKTRGKCSELLIEATTNQAIAALVLDGTSGACKSFLKNFLIKNYDNTRTHSAGGVQPNLNLGLVTKIIYPLPPLAEQHRIVTELERRLSLCDKLEETIAESLQKAEALRQSILKKAFEGKLLNEKELEEARNAPDWEPSEKLVERIRQEKQIKENNNKPTRRKTYG